MRIALRVIDKLKARSPRAKIIQRLKKLLIILALIVVAIKARHQVI